MSGVFNFHEEKVLVGASGESHKLHPLAYDDIIIGAEMFGLVVVRQ